MEQAVASVYSPPGGFPPRGCQAKKVKIGTKRSGEPRYGLKWVIDEEWAPKVRRAWEMKVHGASYREIIRETGIYKSIGCLSDFFRNPVYLGIVKCGDLQVEGAHEPLVDRETWDKVQAQLYSRPRKGQRWPHSSLHPRRKGSTHLLSGLGHCIYCGSSMIGETDKRKDWRFYMCGRKRREGWLLRGKQDECAYRRGRGHAQGAHQGAHDGVCQGLGPRGEPKAGRRSLWS